MATEIDRIPPAPARVVHSAELVDQAAKSTSVPAQAIVPTGVYDAWLAGIHNTNARDAYGAISADFARFLGADSAAAAVDRFLAAAVGEHDDIIEYSIATTWKVRSGPRRRSPGDWPRSGA